LAIAELIWYSAGE